MKHYLKGKTVYLCGAMAAVADDGKQWREYVTHLLKERGVQVLDPTRKKSRCASEIDENKELFKRLVKEQKFQELSEVFAPVARWDLRSVDKADFLVVNYDSTVHTVGTIDEIVIANLERKPILVRYDPEQLDTFNPWLTVRVKPKYLFPTWKDLFAHLDVVDGGEFDRDLWTI
jgi:hypothetical protein